jgi:peptidoglycan L-alanyl-D-glutamate endopeptidase CwlK
MSAGSSDPLLRVNNDLDRLAPAFKDAVVRAIEECRSAGLGAKVYEGFRSAQLQALYYQRGRTIFPPAKPVTNARTNLQSWHGFGLAVDVVHETLFWKPPKGAEWFKQVAAIFRKHGCNWGGEWKRPDPPHFQWGRCEASPSDGVRQLLEAEGLQAVWKRLEAA